MSVPRSRKLGRDAVYLMLARQCNTGRITDELIMVGTGLWKTTRSGQRLAFAEGNVRMSLRGGRGKIFKQEELMLE